MSHSTQLFYKKLSERGRAKSFLTFFNILGVKVS